jgi:pimeloyl-ACP methyl ester carboxylesterase
VTGCAIPPIVLIHGLWITARSWDPWVERYRAAGHEVLAPPWPEMDRPVEELRRDPSGINGLTIPQVVDHFERAARTCDEPPILIGHSFGGLVVQLLLDRGIGSAGVALAPAGPRGVRTVTWPMIQGLLPTLRNPANRRRPAPVTPEGFAAGAANAMPRADALAAWERDIVPAPGSFVFAMAGSNANPRTALRVDFRKPGRAPLLVVSFAEDRMAPPRYHRELVKRQSQGGAVTEYREIPGRSHYIGQPGWEEVADLALDWALAAIPSGHG